MTTDPELIELVDQLREELDIVEAQLAALQAGHEGEALKAEIRRRFGIDRRLQQTMEQVKKQEREIRNLQQWQDRLFVLFGTRDRRAIVDQILAWQGRA